MDRQPKQIPLVCLLHPQLHSSQSLPVTHSFEEEVEPALVEDVDEDEASHEVARVTLPQRKARRKPAKKTADLSDDSD